MAAVSEIPTYVVVPTYKRWGWLSDCINSLSRQVQYTVVIDNNWDEPQPEAIPKTSVLQYTERPPNISRMWNMGLNYIEEQTDHPEWNVLVVNDDVVCPENLVESLSTVLRTTTAQVAYPNQYTDLFEIHTEPEPIGLLRRITGYCFMLKGEAGIRLDEDLVWWYGDDDLDWACRIHGGSALVPGCRVQHRDPDGNTKRQSELRRQANKDRETFRRKWGRTPH